VFVPKVKPLDGLEGFRLALAKGVIWLNGVNKSLKCVKVAFVIRNDGTWVSPNMVHARHCGPFVVQYVEFLTVVNHLVGVITTTNDIYESVFKVIVGCK
jgi:hypothetical protein